jgi:hypothetical protein
MVSNPIKSALRHCKFSSVAEVLGINSGTLASSDSLLTPALDRGGNAQRLAIFCHRAPGDIDAVQL